MARSSFGSIQYIGPDRYRVFWTDNGQRKSKRVSGTRDDAEAFLASMMLERGGVPDVPWASFWKSAVVPTFDRLAEKTVHEYDRLWRVELEPRIGKTMVGQTTWRQVERVLNDMRSATVQQAAKRLWKKMCNLAVRDGLLDRNPVDASIKTAPHRKRAKAVLPAENVADFMGAVEGRKHEAVLLMELGGGLRHEEACAMVRENVSPHEAYGRVYALLRVERGLVSINGRKVLKETKNEFSEREVVVGEPFASRILELCAGDGPVCEGSSKWNGGEYSPAHFASPEAVTRNWRAYCERNGLEYIRPGDMRSIFATLHGEAGTPDSLVSLAMGHSDGTTKGRNYQQNTRRGMIVAADSLADYLAASR